MYSFKVLKTGVQEYTEYAILTPYGCEFVILRIKDRCRDLEGVKGIALSM